MQPDNLEKLPVCSCGSGEKAVYYCQSYRDLLDPKKYKDKCKLAEKRYYYCSSQETCLSNQGHDHRPIKIVEYVDSEVKNWQSFRDSIIILKSQIEKKIIDYQDIIGFYQELSIKRKISPNVSQYIIYFILNRETCIKI